jgi:hypothetical protein
MNGTKYRGFFSESMMLSIKSKSSIEYLHGIKHGMAKEKLDAIIGFYEILENNCILIEGNKGNLE